MAEGKKGFVLYIKHRELINCLSNEDAGILIKKIFDYCSDLNPADTGHPLVEVAFTAIRADLKEDLEKWRNKSEANKRNGLLGGRPKKKEENPKNPDGFEETHEENEKPKKADKDKDKVKDKENNNRDINISCSKQVSSDYDFDTFWSEYPRKVGKDKCLKWFKSHKPKPDLVSKMVEAIKQQKKSKQWSDPQYIPHPYTWLNQGRWEDELETEEEFTSQSKREIQFEEAIPGQSKRMGKKQYTYASTDVPWEEL